MIVISIFCRIDCFDYVAIQNQVGALVVKQTMEPTAPFSLLNSFWQTQLQIIEESELDFKNFALPLARIKKVMKVDDDVKPMVMNFNKQTF